MTAYFDPAPPRILAHRGLALDATENSLGAFRAALDAGATHLETDAHATADGVALLSHDPTLERFDGSDLAVADATWPALRSRRSFDHGTGLITLGEALEAFPDAKFNIDVKAAGAAEPVARAVLAAGASDRVLITSFREVNARAAWRIAPEVAKSASSERTALALLAVELGSERLLRRALGGVDAMQIPQRAVGLTLTRAKRLGAFRRHVREVHVWTINDPDAMIRLWRSGVDGIVTDRTDLANRARASMPVFPSAATDTVAGETPSQASPRTGPSD